MNKIHYHIQNISEKIMTERICVAPGINVCRITTTRTNLIDDEVKATVQETVTGPDGSGRWCVVSPKLLECLRQDGWFDPVSVADLISGKPFTTVLNGEPHVVVRLDWSNHHIYNVNQERLPVGMFFDYTNGVHDGNFDLPGLFQHLKNRSDVVLGNGIEPIPYYNARPDHEYFISFKWAPATEEAFQEYLATIKDRHFRHRYAMTYIGADAFLLSGITVTEDD